MKPAKILAACRACGCPPTCVVPVCGPTPKGTSPSPASSLLREPRGPGGAGGRRTDRRFLNQPLPMPHRCHAGTRAVAGIPSSPSATQAPLSYGSAGDPIRQGRCPTHPIAELVAPLPAQAAHPPHSAGSEVCLSAIARQPTAPSARRSRLMVLPSQRWFRGSAPGGQAGRTPGAMAPSPLLVAAPRERPTPAGRAHHMLATSPRHTVASAILGTGQQLAPSEAVEAIPPGPGPRDVRWWLVPLQQCLPGRPRAPFPASPRGATCVMLYHIPSDRCSLAPETAAPS